MKVCEMFLLMQCGCLLISLCSDWRIKNPAWFEPIVVIELLNAPRQFPCPCISFITLQNYFMGPEYNANALRCLCSAVQFPVLVSTIYWAWDSCQTTVFSQLKTLSPASQLCIYVTLLSSKRFRMWACYVCETFDNLMLGLTICCW